MKCYIPEFTIQIRKLAADEETFKLFTKTYSLIDLYFKSKDKDLNLINQLTICCDKQPATIEDVNALNNFEKFLNTDSPTYSVLEDLLCKTVLGFENDCGVIGQRDYNIVQIKMINLSELKGGSPEAQAVINSLLVGCNKCEKDQSLNTYNNHLCSGDIDSPGPEVEQPVGGGLDDLPPFRPVTLPPPAIDPEGQPPDVGFVNPVPDPEPEPAGPIAPHELDNQVEIAYVDPCIDDIDQKNRKLKLGIPIPFDKANNDAEMQQILASLKQPENLASMRKAILDLGANLDVLKKHILSQILVHVVSSNIPSALSKEQILAIKPKAEMLDDPNLKVGIKSTDLSATWNVTLTNITPVKSDWGGPNVFPVSFIVSLPNTVPSTLRDNILENGNIGRPPKIKESFPPQPILTAGNNYDKYFNLLYKEPGFLKNASNYNPYYNPIVPNNPLYINPVGPEPPNAPVSALSSAVFGITENGILFFPYGTTQKDEVADKLIPIFNQFYFSDSFIVPVELKIKLKAERVFNSAKLKITVLCVHIADEGPGFNTQPAEQDCDVNKLSNTLFYVDGKPKATFDSDNFDGHPAQAPKHFPNDSLIIIDKKNQANWAPTNSEDIIVSFKTELKYVKKKSQNLIGFVHSNPFHPIPDERKFGMYSTEISAHYNLSMPTNPDKPDGTRETSIPGTTNLKTWYKTIEKFIYSEIAKQPLSIARAGNQQNVRPIPIPEASISAVFSAQIKSEQAKCCCCKWVPAENVLSDTSTKLVLKTTKDEFKWEISPPTPARAPVPPQNNDGE